MSEPPEATPLRDVARLAIHTKTTQPLDLRQAIATYTRHGVRGISVWRDALQAVGVAEGAQRLRDAGMHVPALVRGGFFVARDAAARQHAHDDNLHALDEAAAIGAEMVVLVVGSAPDVPLASGRSMVRDGIAALLPHAASRGVRLAIEPLHPMYAADKSCINRLRDANDLCEALAHPLLGVAVDVYHTWWDPELEAEIARAARWLFGFHVCDWRVVTRDLLLDRGLMGEGCVPLRSIRAAVERAGFRGWHEVEIFSTHYWGIDQDDFVRRIREAYLAHC